MAIPNINYNLLYSAATGIQDQADQIAKLGLNGQQITELVGVLVQASRHGNATAFETSPDLVAQAYRVLEASSSFNSHPFANETLNALRPLARQSAWARRDAGSSGIFGKPLMSHSEIQAARDAYYRVDPRFDTETLRHDGYFDPRLHGNDRPSESFPRPVREHVEHDIGSRQEAIDGLYDIVDALRARAGKEPLPRPKPVEIPQEKALRVAYERYQQTGEGIQEFIYAVEAYLNIELNRRVSKAELVQELTTGTSRYLPALRRLLGASVGEFDAIIEKAFESRVLTRPPAAKDTLETPKGPRRGK